MSSTFLISEISHNYTMAVLSLHCIFKFMYCIYDLSNLVKITAHKASEKA
jgi:hypothetical protein